MDIVLAIIGIWVFIKGQVNIGGGKKTSKKQGRLLGSILVLPTILFLALPFFGLPLSLNGGMIVYGAVIIALLVISKSVTPNSVASTEQEQTSSAFTPSLNVPEIPLAEVATGTNKSKVYIRNTLVISLVVIGFLSLRNYVEELKSEAEGSAWVEQESNLQFVPNKKKQKIETQESELDERMNELLEAHEEEQNIFAEEMKRYLEEKAINTSEVSDIDDTSAGASIQNSMEVGKLAGYPELLDKINVDDREVWVMGASMPQNHQVSPQTIGCYYPEIEFDLIELALMVYGEMTPIGEIGVPRKGVDASWLGISGLEKVDIKQVELGEFTWESPNPYDRPEQVEVRPAYRLGTRTFGVVNLDRRENLPDSFYSNGKVDFPYSNNSASSIDWLPPLEDCSVPGWNLDVFYFNQDGSLDQSEYYETIEAGIDFDIFFNKIKENQDSDRGLLPGCDFRSCG